MPVQAAPILHFILESKMPAGVRIGAALHKHRELTLRGVCSTFRYRAESLSAVSAVISGQPRHYLAFLKTNSRLRRLRASFVAADIRHHLAILQNPRFLPHRLLRCTAWISACATAFSSLYKNIRALEHTCACRHRYSARHIICFIT